MCQTELIEIFAELTEFAAELTGSLSRNSTLETPKASNEAKNNLKAKLAAGPKITPQRSELKITIPGPEGGLVEADLASNQVQ